MKIRILAGGVPDPEELFGREHLIQYIWDQLAGNNIYLVAPRRFGKSGVMRHILKRPKQGYLPIYVDVEDIWDPDLFAYNLVGELLTHKTLRKFVVGMRNAPKTVLDFIQNRIEEIKGGVKGAEIGIKLKNAVKDDWQAVSRRLITEMEKADETVVFIIDEFPECVDNIRRKHGAETAKAFLLWFRSLRLKQKDQLRRFRFILGGSTGIDMILRKLEVSDKLNDCVRVPVEAFSPEVGKELLNALGKKYDIGFTEEAVEKFFGFIGPPVPYFIHLFFSQLYFEETLKGKKLTPKDVEDVYRKRVLGPTCREYFEPYRQRLKRYGLVGERAALALLGHIAESSTGKASESMLYEVYRTVRKKKASELEFREIMADLECDWYVVLDPATNEYFFLLNVMKDWWRRFYRRITKK